MAGAANKSSVSWRKPSSCPPVAKMLYACAMARAVPTALPDGTSRLRVDAVRIKIDSCARIDLKCPVDVRAPIHCFQCQAKREADQHREPPRRRNGRQTRVRDLLREPDVDVQSKGRRDLVLEELSQAPMMRIDTPQQLALVETKRERVIRLARAWFPRGFLACEHYCHAIEVCDDAAIDRLVDREQPCLVCQASSFALFNAMRGACDIPLTTASPSIISIQRLSSFAPICHTEASVCRAPCSSCQGIHRSRFGNRRLNWSRGIMRREYLSRSSPALPYPLVDAARKPCNVSAAIALGRRRSHP